ncbi:DNA-binding LacI/PurR family transcriptional regulator [Leucobacter exalbidus]|uniref:DNA-binding LacI/PurR family transcriptional regulator n=1 Tax=Leucobacter exalbidus TaxID=662960 RepID=A0A940PN98_9MICO|nr:LacI family DNA-binding transcriptional regulator [Leucobacter exalbidus]MBP1326288.1 DNA-binding LacI/PurR family transcriptional regulator [Leucobacter exalbidus]
MPPRRSSQDKAPSQVDVARLAGVSAQTVSRVMSNQGSVRPETARRVLAAVDELGYRIHAAAASLASGRTRLLGVIIVSNDRYSIGAHGVGIEQAAAAHGYTVTTAAVAEHASSDAFIEAFDRLERQGAEGIILGIPIDLDTPAMRVRTERTPTVRSERSELDPHSPFAVDQALIGRLAVEHLLELGHRTVWHVTGDDYWMETDERRTAWQQVLTEHGITPPPVIPGNWTPESGYRAGRTIAAIPDATAVFVSSDEMAFGVLRALHEAGKRVPEDVSVVSVDGIPLSAYASPALTTVRQPFEDVGRAAALRLIAMLEGSSVGELPHIEPTLVVRASTAPPAK